MVEEEVMLYEEQGGINWTWFKVRKGNLVAVFRLHYGEEPLQAFRKLQRKMTEAHIDVPFATWREPCDLIADHTGKTEGYNLPEVAEAFGWLNTVYRNAAIKAAKWLGGHELGSCPEGTMRHLEYHGVAIVRVGRVAQVHRDLEARKQKRLSRIERS